LSQELPGFEVEDPFMRRTSIATNKVSASCKTMLQTDLKQLLIARLFSGVEDDRDVHHDVDE
jgi:hypothetical protein